MKQTVNIQRKDQEKYAKKLKKEEQAPQMVYKMYENENDRQEQFGHELLPDVPEEDQSSATTNSEDRLDTQSLKSIDEHQQEQQQCLQDFNPLGPQEYDQFQLKKNLPGKHKNPNSIDAKNIATEQKLYDVSSDSEPPEEDAGDVADESESEAFNNKTPPSSSAERGEP